MINRRNFLKRTAGALAGAATWAVGKSLPLQLGGYVKSETLAISDGETFMPVSLGHGSPYLFDNFGLSFSLQEATDAQITAAFVTELTKKVERGEVKAIDVGEYITLFLEQSDV